MVTKICPKQNGKGKEGLDRHEKCEILYFLETKQNMMYWGHGEEKNPGVEVLSHMYTVINAWTEKTKTFLTGHRIRPYHP